MKQKIEVETAMVREYGANIAVALAMVCASYEPLTNTELANMMNVSFPTAQKCLNKLAELRRIKYDGKVYKRNDEFIVRNA